MNYRQEMIAEAIRLCGDAILENLHAFLPADFDLQQIDLDEMPAIGSLLAAVVVPPDPAVPAASPVEVDDSFLDPGPAIVDTIVEAPTLSGRLQDRLDAAIGELAAARAANSRAHYAAAEAINVLSAAVTQFQSGFPRYTPSDLIRDHLRSEQATRAAAVARGEVAPVGPAGSRPGNSVVDRMAFYSKGGGLESGKYGSYKRTACVLADRARMTPAQKILATPGKRV